MVGNDGMSGEKGYGFVDINFYKNLLAYFINNNKKLIIISDLVQYPIPKTENIVLFKNLN